MDIVLDNIIEKDYGWVMFCQSKKFIETGDDWHMELYGAFHDNMIKRSLREN